MKRWRWRALGFGVLTLLWGLAVWFVLPVDRVGGLSSLPSLALLHLGPPVSVMAAWFVGKWGLAWRTRRKADRVAQSAAQEEQARREAERTEREAALRQRRAYLECRGIFLALARVPEWLNDGLAQGRWFVREAEVSRGTGGEAALAGDLSQVFKAMFRQSAAFAWLPVHVVSRRESIHEAQLEGVRSIWREAAAACFEDAPVPDCRMLSGAGPLAARVMALFENDPDLPALVLLGMDSPLGNAPKDDDLNPAPDGKEDIQPGHAVALVVLSRPGLAACEADGAGLARQLADPNLPYWEHDRTRREADHAAPDQQAWGKVPVSLQADFCALEPFAALYRPESADWRDDAQGGPQVKPLQTAMKTAAINAALREPPGDGEAGKDGKPVKLSAPNEPAPLDVGWLAHNSGGADDPMAADRLVCVLRALNGQGCELNAAKAAGNLLIEHGEVGAAAGALMLAEALIRAARLQKPALMAEFRGGAVDICVARPAPAR
jgi:hypothetical protein